MLTKDRIDKHALQAVDCPPATWVVLRSAMHRLIDKESAATAPLLARIAELERELEEARKDEREHWENACRLMLVARSGQITDMALAERLVGLISEDRKEKQAIRAAIKEQT